MPTLCSGEFYESYIAWALAHNTALGGRAALCRVRAPGGRLFPGGKAGRWASPAGEGEPSPPWPWEAWAYRAALGVPVRH